MAALSVLTVEVGAQEIPADTAASRTVRYSAMIEMPRGYVSGICVMAAGEEGEETKGCLFNEFGLSAIEFSYWPSTGKVQLHRVAGFLDHRRVRRLLRQDLSRLLQSMDGGGGAYHNEKYNIDYRFTLLPHEAEE